MKAIIENKIKEVFIREFLILVNLVVGAETEQDLRNNMEDYDRMFFFGVNFLMYGFGSNHMWVSEKETGERIIIVKF